MFGKIDNLKGKQTIIKTLYEKFFKGAIPLTWRNWVMSITPVECVDFMVRSVDVVLRKEFDCCLSDKNVHILDPFVGTGHSSRACSRADVSDRKIWSASIGYEIHSQRDRAAGVLYCRCQHRERVSTSTHRQELPAL
jgi:predicted helicase